LSAGTSLTALPQTLYVFRGLLVNKEDGKGGKGKPQMNGNGRKGREARGGKRRVEQGRSSSCALGRKEKSRRV